MFTVIMANDGSQYESSESIILIDISKELSENKTEEEIMQEIEKSFNTDWCNCSHDCCGHWKTSVATINIYYNRAIVYCYHSQNV